MVRKKTVKRKSAKDFGDNPKIRGGRERSSFNKSEPWEVRHRLVKRKKSKSKSKR